MESRTVQMGLWMRTKIFLEMIKFSHTIFALPFALTGAVLAAGGLPSGRQLFWIIMAMVGARTVAMGLNRLIDAEIDARNPRTAGRAIPAGLIGKGTVLLFILLSGMLLITAAAALNPLCLYLAPVAFFFLTLYSYCKRFTALAHVVLGLCLAAAPMGAWIAITGSFSLIPLLLALAVLFWVAGFDILYALQDLEFDCRSGLHSIPVRFGPAVSLRIARVFHAVAFLLLCSILFQAPLGGFYLTGLIVTAAMLLYEHWLLRDGDLTKLDAAFFNVNGYISVTIFLFTFLDVMFDKGGA